LKTNKKITVKKVVTQPIVLMYFFI
ncbi:uncharacterized protein METZ01_LOCUS168227, partial [marine metagenome]